MQKISFREICASNRIIEVYFDDPVYKLVWHNGFTEFFKSPKDIIKAISKKDKKDVRGKGSITTTINWNDMPEGFIPPKL